MRLSHRIMANIAADTREWGLKAGPEVGREGSPKVEMVAAMIVQIEALQGRWHPNFVGPPPLGLLARSPT